MMKQTEVVQLLIKINHGIYLCYQDLIAIELDENKKNRSEDFMDIYRKIREYRSLEDEFFLRLKNSCFTNKDIDKIYNYIFDLYQVSDGVSFLPTYIKYLDRGIEARRVLERVKSEIVIPPEITIADEDDEMLTSADIDDILSLAGEEAILTPLIDDEDVIRLISKIDTELLLNCENNQKSLSKKQLYELKYDLFFLNRKFEGMLVEDWCLPSLSLVDAKNMACFIFDLKDEKVERVYDNLRENEILLLVEDLSQKKNRGNSIENKLRYILIDMWMESLSDQVVSTIMERIEDKVENSYSEDIFEARDTIYQGLYAKYEDRIMDSKLSEAPDEEELVKKSSSKKKTKLRKH